MMQIDYCIVIQLTVLDSQIIKGRNGLFDKFKDLLAMDVERLIDDEDCGKEEFAFVEFKVFCEVRDCGLEDVCECGEVSLATGDFRHGAYQKGFHGLS